MDSYFLYNVSLLVEVSKIAYEEKKIIRWKYYKGWEEKKCLMLLFALGGSITIKQLFAIKDPTSKEKIRFPMTTNGRDADALKITLEIHKLKRYKDSWYIYDRLCKKRLDKFFTCIHRTTRYKNTE